MSPKCRKHSMTQGARARSSRDAWAGRGGVGRNAGSDQWKLGRTSLRTPPCVPPRPPAYDSVGLARYSGRKHMAQRTLAHADPQPALRLPCKARTHHGTTAPYGATHRAPLVAHAPCPSRLLPTGPGILAPRPAPPASPSLSPPPFFSLPSRLSLLVLLPAHSMRLLDVMIAVPWRSAVHLMRFRFSFWKLLKRHTSLRRTLPLQSHVFHSPVDRGDTCRVNLQDQEPRRVGGRGSGLGASGGGRVRCQGG